MATQQQIPQEQQQFQPTLTKEQTRVSVNSYRDNPNPQYLETLRSHAQYHNIPFYEGEFGILDAIKQAAGGFWEGFTTLRLADPPDNEYEAIIRNVFHLGGFVPGFFAAPIRALGVAAKSKRLLEASRAIGGLKSIPMRGADWVTKHAKESVIRPALKSSIGSRFKAVDTTSKFMLQEGAKHITEGAFHLGVASSISSIWGGVDEMMHSFMGGAVAGGVFRGIGNIIPGTKAGDKALRALSGSIFMGMPSTARGATTPEQVYEYLLGAYFGGKEMPWSRARAHKVVQRGVEQATGTDKKQKDIKLDIERDPELIKGWEKEPEIVREEATKLWRKMYPEEAYNKGMAYYEMKLLGILDQIPEDKIEDVGYRVLHAVRKGRQRRTKTKAHEDINVATSGGSPEVETEWARVMDKYGVPVIQYLTPDKIYDYEKRYKAGKIPTTSIQRDLTIDELYDKAFVVDKANEILNRDISKLIPQSYEGILKNAWQIEKAGSVFAIGEIDTGRTGKDAHLNGRSVKGAPGWGIQMAIDKGLDKIYVFDQSKKQQRWYEWNHNANRFTPMGENIVPKLTRNPALLGPIPHKHKGRTYNRITKAGKEAIKSVARETFGEAPEQPKEVRTVPTPVKKYGQKNLQAQKRKEAEIDTKEKNILDMQEVINEGKVDKIRLKDLEARIKEEQKEIESLRGEIKVLKELGPTGYIDEITGEIVESSDVVDTGMKADDFPLMQKSERFATENLKDIWKDSSNRRNKILELGRITEDIIRKYIKKGDKDVKSLEAIKDMEKEFGKLSDIAKQQVRRWLTVENLGQNVTYVRSYGNSLLQITHPDNPVSLAGNPLRQVEAPKLIEDIFRAEGGTYGGKEFRTPLVIFDTITGKKKNGLPVDVPLDRLFEYYRFTENMSKKEAEAKVISVKKDIINRMYNEHNMYALGGQGDKGRLVFVKFHPKTQSSSKTKIGTYITKVRKELKKVDKNYSSLLANDKDAARRELGISSEAFDKMLHSNVLYELSLNGLKNTPENIEKIMKHNPDEPGEGFISNAIAYNKRAQIWLMGGYSGDKNFISNRLTELQKENKAINDLNNGDFNYVLIKDPKKSELSSLLAKNVDLPEHVDGAIIVRDDIIRVINEDAAHPESGQNKSFIIDPNSKHGALLGKYMMHTAGRQASKEMARKGLHMMVMTSSAKQYGTRTAGDYTVTNGKLALQKAPIYNLNPGSIKYTTSVTNTPHMLQKQIWVKQLFTNLHQYGYETIDKSIISDIHQEIIQKSFKGNKTYNTKLDNYLKTLDRNVVDDLVENLENLGTTDLIKALKTPGAELFAERAMQKMLRIIEKDIEMQFQEGEITAAERGNTLSDMKQAISPIDNMLRQVAFVGEKAAMEGKAAYSGYMHKYLRDYKAAVLHNYFVKSTTRPSVDNSAVARIRPYDKWMQEDFKDLNTNDTIFYLDNAYRDTLITLPDGEKISLGKLWRLKDSSEYKDIAQEVFDAVVLRVPMDSISGAHRLTFKGFTDREGHGIMMHARTMRALGGADLDGDEAFVYFGGRAESGKGYGMKKSWKEAIHAQKEEFYEGKGSKRDVQNNKDAFRDELTLGAGKDNPLKTSKALYFSPYSRIKASEGAVDGRNRLGVAVSNAQVLKSSYSALMEADGKIDRYNFYDKFSKKTYRVTRTPKESDSERKRQRDLTRAQIAFASDPLDEVGLKDSNFFFKSLHDAYFNISKVEVYNPKTKRFENAPKGAESKLKNWQLKKGLVETFKNMNSAYFGRNYAEGRRFTMDEVNELASSIANLDPKQINTMLPKMVSTLEGLDWSDSIFNRVDRVRIKDYYDEINKMTGVKFNWLRKHMDRSSFKVPYNNHIDVVVKNKLFDRDVRRRLAADTSTRGLINYLDAIKGTIWAKEVMKDINNSITTTKSGKKYIKPDTWFFNEKKRLSHLSLLARQAEDFLSNDLADISTILNIKRILDRTKGTGELTGTRIDYITRKVEQIKTRSYLNVKERRKVKYDAYLGTEEEQNLQKAFDYVDDYNAKQQGKIPKQKELLGDKRSASWDQKKIDDEIIIFKRGLKNDSEKELFDHLLIGSLKRGKVQELQNLLSKINLKIYNPAVLDVITQAINESADTRLSRVGFNSQAVSSKAMRDHFEMMNDALVDTWKVPSSKDINKEIENVNKAAKENNIGEVSEVDDMVEGVLRGEAYAGIKKADITQKDKELMVRLASNLKKHNNKLGNNLNEVLGGIMVEATGRAKDLNTMNRQDFILVNEFLEEVESGTMFQKMFGKKGAPEIKRRYWWMFPEAVNRELMAYDIKWLKEEGYFLTKDGTAKARPIRRPTYFLEILQNWVHKSGSLATAKAEELASKTEADFLNIRELKEGEALFDIAVRGRELSEKESIDKTDELQPIKDMWKKNYDTSYREAAKKHNWEKLRKQKFTLTNDAGERVTVSGQEIVFGSKKKHNLTGIRDKLTKKFEEYHKLIVGDKSMRDEYIEKDKYGTGIYYDGVEQTQPKMNWRKFVKDMGNALEKGQDIPVQLGIDGMRHMARSMMADLSKGKYKEDFEAMHIGKTGQRNPEAYWPHMFFSRSQAERSMQKAIEHIRQRPDLTEEQKKKQIANITVRHKTLTGDWEFQDMQDWDRIDVLDMEQAYKDIADVKKKQKEKEKTDIKWTNMNQKFGSMFSRKGHIAGWATDINVLNAYTRNLTQTYYRQLTQIMSRDVLDKSYHRMSKKFGPELAKRWDKFFKLYVQGAMGQPDIIPEEIYNDPKMKIKGTPYAWFADNKVLDRVNKIRKKLGIREDGLPKELKDFTYQDIRAWSNLEAKWELASLLAHPKSSITNIWGGSLHTIQSAGLTALRKARNIKYLQRINPNGTSMKDVEKFVISKGVVPEFLVHELGLGREVSKKNIQDFVGELSEKINSNDPIARKEIRSLGKKYNLGEEVTRLASKFMSVPERMLRRDAFMAHYIRAWERYGGAIRDPNHPFLIEMGKKGVKATQFLYEAPFRPFFARTALGKVMSRFQLFAWNSARFRNDIMRGAKLYGFKPGSEAFQRYKRTMEIDLFVLALGNMFAFSLFDNALPSPWNWFQDTSEWLFGDEKERDKAFFGMYPSKIAPLQVITPPIARFPVSALRQWIDDDYSKFSEYTAWTLFPFGRMIRDVAQPDQGLIHNPTRIIEKVAGLPVQDLARQRRKKKEAIEKGERYQLPKVGIKF